jgi:hypothetical protein
MATLEITTKLLTHLMTIILIKKKKNLKSAI